MTDQTPTLREQIGEIGVHISVLVVTTKTNQVLSKKTLYYSTANQYNYI